MTICSQGFIFNRQSKWTSTIAKEQVPSPQSSMTEGSIGFLLVRKDELFQCVVPIL